jgi:hypothetical protein
MIGYDLKSGAEKWFLNGMPSGCCPLTVLKAGSDKPEVLATNPKLGERTAATPAIADDALFVRTEKHLYAFAEKK